MSTMPCIPAHSAGRLMRIACGGVIAVSLLAPTLGAQTPKPKPKPKPSTSPGASGPRASTASKAPYDGPATLLFQVDAPCRVWIDGTLALTAAKDDVKPVKIALGDHLIKVETNDGLASWQRVINIPRAEQKILATEIATSWVEAKRKKAQEVGQRAVAALGGMEAIQGIRTVVLEFSINGFPARQYFQRRPAAFRAELGQSGQPLTVTINVGGTTYASQSGGSWTSQPASPPPLLVDGWVSLAAGKLPCELQDQNAREVTLLCAGDNRLVFNAASGLPERELSGNGGSDTYSDYRRVDGILWPFLWRSMQSKDDKLVLTRTYSAVEINRELDADLFKIPTPSPN